MKTFYLTTPIYYVNDKPHIGHAYTTILADVLTRFHRNTGEDVFFLTGLDEHGQKVQQAAEKRGVDPQKHCNEMAPRFLELWENLHIQNDDFIRTTEKRHVDVVQHILQKVYDKGDIYEDVYEGLYSVSEERFITEKEAKSGEFRDIKELKEKNYFFRMSNYQQTLIDHIKNNSGFIQPEHRKNEVLGFLKQPLEDICISRPKSRLGWGIELPFDSDYVTYVWFGALINYISAHGPLEKIGSTGFWPVNHHLLGKDILTTHAVYWSTMLKAIGFDPPLNLFAHGWWTINGHKMSKSVGNTVEPNLLVDQFGVDAIRYFLLREVPFGLDGDFSHKALIGRINSDLANNYGNFCQRTFSFAEKNCKGIVPSDIDFNSEDLKLLNSFSDNIKKIRSFMDNQLLNEYVKFIVDKLFDGINKTAKKIEE